MKKAVTRVIDDFVTDERIHVPFMWAMLAGVVVAVTGTIVILWLARL